MSYLDPLKDELAVTITKIRGGAGAGEMAERLLRNDGGRNRLIGLTKGAETAIYYDSTMWSLHEVPFDQAGNDGLRTRKMEEVRIGGLESVLAKKGEEWLEWWHPRYRWVFNGTDDVSILEEEEWQNPE